MTTTVDQVRIIRAYLDREYPGSGEGDLELIPTAAKPGEMLCDTVIRLLTEAKEFRSTRGGPEVWEFRARSRPDLIWVWDKGVVVVSDLAEGFGFDGMAELEREVLAAHLRYALKKLEAVNNG